MKNCGIIYKTIKMEGKTMIRKMLDDFLEFNGLTIEEGVKRLLNEKGIRREIFYLKKNDSANIVLTKPGLCNKVFKIKRRDGDLRNNVNIIKETILDNEKVFNELNRVLDNNNIWIGERIVYVLSLISKYQEI